MVSSTEKTGKSMTGYVKNRLNTTDINMETVNTVYLCQSKDRTKKFDS